MKFFQNILLVSSLLFISVSPIQAQYVYIPDSAFRSFLLTDGFQQAFNGDSLDTSSVLVTNRDSLNCSGYGIQSLEGIQYFDNLIFLDCSVNYLTTLPALPQGLLNLKCEKNLLTTSIILPANLLELNCGHNPLISLPNLPPNLLYLYCDNVELNSLPLLPPNLYKLQCDSNYIQIIDSLPSRLNTLECNFGQLNNIVSVPPSLRILRVFGNFLTSLPLLPDSLEQLEISYNAINPLPALPTQLSYLRCGSNGLNNLPALPDSLKYLDVSNNNLTELPIIPYNIITLNVDWNFIDSMPQILLPQLFILSFSNNPVEICPPLPSNLNVLGCSDTKLRSIPPLPSNLALLFCGNDSLIALPILPSSLQHLYCSNNFISELPMLPDSMEMLYIYNNPIHCLPPISFIRDFDFNWTFITCLPNSINIGRAVSPAIDNFPLCQPSSGCPVYWNISGNIFNDLNADCIRDTNEQELKNIPVLLDSSGTIVQIVYTNTNGDYSFRAPLGNYFVRINPLNFPFPFVCPASGVLASLLTPIDSIQPNLDFALSCPNAFDLIARSVGPETMFRPTRLVKVIANAGDLLNQIGTSCFTDSGYVQCTFSGPITYAGPASGAFTADYTPPSTLRWNVSDFTTLNPLTDFNFNVYVDSFAQINEPVCFNLSVFPVSGDIFPFDNFTSSCYPVRVAVDPNEKFMSPSGSVDTADHVFNFTVFFQNTGNAPAEDIYILDTLDNDLDPATFEFVSSSHSVVTQLLPGNVLRFNFQAINLIDSVTNESQSHGQVKFRLKRKSNTGMGTEISNTAYIFFDQNAGVKTNTVSAIVTSVVGIPELKNARKLMLYPNPATKYIHSMDVCSGKGIVEIKDLLGQLISTFYLNNREQIYFDTEIFSPGIYFISLSDNNGRRSGTFVKE